MMEKDKEAVTTENDELRHELGMYKSIAVAPESKSRGFMTRIARAPLTTQNINAPAAQTSSSNTKRISHSKSMSRIPVKSTTNLKDVEYKDGDMTLEEIL